MGHIYLLIIINEFLQSKYEFAEGGGWRIFLKGPAKNLCVLRARFIFTFIHKMKMLKPFVIIRFWIFSTKITLNSILYSLYHSIQGTKTLNKPDYSENVLSTLNLRYKLLWTFYSYDSFHQYRSFTFCDFVSIGYLTYIKKNFSNNFIG